MTETQDLMLNTQRLLLRPFRATDAAALQRACGNLNVARMTSRIPHPYPDGAAAQWIAAQDALRREASEFNFCIEHAGTLVGSAGLRAGKNDRNELGYWIAEPCWGHGFATEAARRVVRFAFDQLGAACVSAGHYLDNPASGRVLEKCGFRYTRTDTQWSVARGAAVDCKRFMIEARTAGR